MTAAALLAQLREAGYRIRLRDDGAGVRVEPRPPEVLVAELVPCRAALLDLLRREAEPVAGELAACQREADDLHRLRTGLGDDVDGLLCSTLDRLDTDRAERCWHHVRRALADGLLSRLVAWVRSLADAHGSQLDALLASGPRAHGYHDAQAAERRTKAEVETLLAELVADRIELERAGVLPAALLRGANLREMVEARQQTLGLEVAAHLVRRLYAAAVACNVEALTSIEGGP